MLIVGLNTASDAWGEAIDGGSCAIIDGQTIRAAVAEERISRRKHAGGFAESLPYLLKRCGISTNDVDLYCVSHYAQPLGSSATSASLLADYLGTGRVSERVITVPSHHLSHACSSFYLSPYDEAIIVVADNEGSLLQPLSHVTDGHRASLWFERNSYYWGCGNEIQLLERDLDAPGEFGFGRMYSRFTRYLGFGNYHNAGKTMGLSSFADPTQGLPDLWALDSSERLVSGPKDTRNLSDLRTFFEDAGVTVPPPGGHLSYMSLEYQRLAAYIQSQLCFWFAKKLSSLVKRTGIRHVCLGGGVALNSSLNSYLESELNVTLFVPPYPSDEGQALGNAIYGLINQRGQYDRSFPFRFRQFSYLGPEYSDEEHRTAAENAETGGRWQLIARGAPAHSTAALIADGKTVGWFQGRSEYGARALGNRSILVDPRRGEWRETLNLKKGRETFRPFAPSVLALFASDYFELHPTPLLEHMLAVVRVRPEVRDLIPAVVHVDGTARPQLVFQEANPDFHDLITAFYRLTKIPMVLNTSFNQAGEPIVETPRDAVSSADAMELDILVLGQYILARRCS